MSEQKTNLKRKSRFGEREDKPEKKPIIDISAAAAKAAEISKELTSKIAQVSSLLSNINEHNGIQIPIDKKPAYRPLLLDSLGREVDEHGNLVKKDSIVKTLAANVAAENAKKKKENPYLSHRANIDEKDEDNIQLDERITFKKRELRAKKGLNFIEAGKLIKEADKLLAKEERKLIAGYTSGRKNLEHEALKQKSDDETGKVEVAEKTKTVEEPGVHIPPPLDIVLPKIEWWDEHFLPKEIRDSRKISKAAAENDDFEHLSLLNNKTYKYIQHPVPIKPLGLDNQNQVLPMYLTKKERKKIRKATRQEREREKRDKMMVGLIPPPEPKFKLSNFMKVLGDQAVADPSKVEMRVLQQMQQRVLNHQMRNQAAKLTPKERREKKIKKLQEDTSKNVHVAVFRIVDFSNLKHRFKVDVNAQQHFLSGIVLLCPEDNLNLVVAEGGPKGIRKFVKLLSERIDWNAKFIPNERQLMKNFTDGIAGSDEHNLQDFDQMDAVEDEEEDDEENDQFDPIQENSTDSSKGKNRCDLLWQGIVPKRIFSGFKFHETKSASAARKMLESKGVVHYWDMVENADNILKSSESLSLF